jgi:hypothetical protein
MSEDDFKSLYKGLLKCSDPRTQCFLVDRKSLVYGYRLHLFVLAFRPGLCEVEDERGLDESEWKELTSKIKAHIYSFFPLAEIYVEKWSNSRKFQLRWETYIQTREP